MARRELDELIRAGHECRSRGEAMTAEPLLRRAVVVAESNRADPDQARNLATALNELGIVCKDLAKHDEARALYHRALGVLEQSPNAGAHDIAALYHNLGGIEHAKGNYVAAEPLARSGITVRQLFGDDDDVLAADFVALAAILDGQRKFDEAEAMYLAALAILEHSPEPNRGEIAVALNNLGANYLERGRTEEAIELLGRAAELKRACLGERHPDLAVTLNNLAVAKKRGGHLAAAKPLYNEAVEILKTSLGAEHPKAVACRRNLSRLEESLMSMGNDGSERNVRIDLTAEQKQIVKTATNREADAIELTIEELEQRIAPSSTTGYTGGMPIIRLAGNHNETLVDDSV